MRTTEISTTINNEAHQGNGGDESHLKVREYVNRAVYVETTYDMQTVCKQNSIYMNIPGSGDHPKVLKVKRCLCFTNPTSCPCHPRSEDDDDEETTPVTIRPRCTSSTSALIPKKFDTDTSNFESDSGITVKHTISTPDELRLSIPSLTTISTVRIVDETTREENFRNWCARKDQEKKIQDQKQLMLEEMKRKQREAQVENERENFRRWLANKKIEEETKRKDSEARQRDEYVKEELKEKRSAENELSFQLWLQKKEKVTLEKKIKEQMMLMQKEEERQKRIEYSTRAYEIWLEQSKNKQRPVPMNRGLESLKSSVSVTYINPQPWVPNIEVKEKPNSQ